MKAHDKKHFKPRNAGRKQKIRYSDAEPILALYFNNEIGRQECLHRLGYSRKLHQLPKIFGDYKKKHNIHNFYNNVDLVVAKTKQFQDS